MSLISVELQKDKDGKITSPIAEYHPDEKTKQRYALMRESFILGNMNMNTPRREFNDLSLVERVSVDRMSWNTYQPNDGDPYAGDPMNAWKSNAIKPIVRNKCISMAAHATAQLIFPKVFAQNRDSDEDRAAAQVMRDLMEWVAYQSKYSRTFVQGVINAIVDPIAIIHTEYCEVMRTVRVPKASGGYEEKEIVDDAYSGFQNTLVAPNELYIENFYEHDIQKQGFLLLRKVIGYQGARAKYENEYPENFAYVKPGMQMVYSDANNAFYYVYDPNLTGELVEEVVYWHRNFDLKLTFVNGVLMCDPDSPNPRLDKKYPFATTGYEFIDNGNFFYYKSLVFKMGPDAKIVNQLYPMIVDATYLSVFPPMMVKGGEEIQSDVIVPGAVTTLSAPDAELKPINTNNNLAAGMNTLMGVLQSIDQSSQDPQMMGEATPGTKTAYETATLQKNANTDLSLFLKMVGYLVEDFGYLQISDILQHLTIADAALIAGKPLLKYKSFMLPATKGPGGRAKTKKIMFDINMPDEPITKDALLVESMKLLALEGGPNGKKEIAKVNPELFSQMKFQLLLSPDIMTPLSDEVQHAFQLEAYDRMIQNPNLDQKQITKDFLLGAYDISRDDPDKYFAMTPPPAQGPEGNAYAPGMQGKTPAAGDIMNKVAQASKSGLPNRSAGVKA
jgi:hypothetical protein